MDNNEVIKQKTILSGLVSKLNLENPTILNHLVIQQNFSPEYLRKRQRLVCMHRLKNDHADWAQNEKMMVFQIANFFVDAHGLIQHRCR